MGAHGVFISWRSGGVGDQVEVLEIRWTCWRSGGGGGGGCNMMAIVIPAGWLSLMLLMFFPASAIARMGPGTYPSVRTISYVGQPRAFVNDGGSVQDQQITPQEVNTIFGKNDDHGWITSNGRRELVGSSPPTCVGRCGACVPCMPVSVAITSPQPVISETGYYPEVWRCLCGNTHYMP